MPLRVRLKGQRPDDECLFEFTANDRLIKTIHDAKKRGGTVWVRFELLNGSRRITVTQDGRINESYRLKLVVRDILE